MRNHIPFRLECDAIFSLLIIIIITRIYFVILASLVVAESKNVSLVQSMPDFVAIEEGKNVSMLCKAISPITSCSFIVPGELEEIKISPNETSSNDAYEYYGSGFDNGECGITIIHIKKENNGKASCIVDLNEHLRRVGTDIQITITKELFAGKLIVLSCTPNVCTHIMNKLNFM